jgi:hypothetical protein
LWILFCAPPEPAREGKRGRIAQLMRWRTGLFRLRLVVNVPLAFTPYFVTALMRPTMLLLLVVGSICLGGSLSTSAQSSVTLDFYTERSPTLNEPVILIARVTNAAPAPLEVDFGINEETKFLFRHTLPDNSVAQAQPQSPTNGPGFLGPVEIRGGTSHKVQLVLNRWLDFTSVGRHQVEVTFLGSVARKGGAEVEISRNKILVIDVTPRDEKRLTGQCQHWLSVVLETNDALERRDAANALGSVFDPVAVPFLERGILESHAGGFFPALVKIGDANAKAALERLATNPRADIQQQARSSLDLLRRWERRPAPTCFAQVPTWSIGRLPPGVCQPRTAPPFELSLVGFSACLSRRLGSPAQSDSVPLNRPLMVGSD